VIRITEFQPTLAAVDRMHQPNHTIEAPTPQALADLVARCDEINRYATQLVAAEENRIAALAAGILTMRRVLELKPIPVDRLPARQGRIGHWALTGGHLSEAVTPAIKRLHATLALDEHEQVKILSDRTWRGVWRRVELWRDGVHGLSASALMEYLAQLTSMAQRSAPEAARSLLTRGEAVFATHSISPVRPRTRAD
jgi:hypothetical protein